MEKQQIGFQTITKKVATNIHEFLYSGVKLADQDKATLIAGILIALENDTFRNTYRNMTDADQFIDSFMSAIKHSILRYKGLQNEKETVISTFDFIGKNPNFKTSLENNGKIYITLQFLTEILEKSIYKIAKLNPSYDILGEFYNEFTKYSGADQQSLGIVLTPKHVAHFMAELLEVTEEDVLVDTCIGTGSLVLTADMETETPNKILGVEFNARMLSLAAANMMIRGIDSHLILGDSYSEKILENLATQKPTKLIINPPYAQDGYPELGFLCKGLDILQPGGLGVAILPMSTAIKTDNLTKSLKKELLDKHTLLATFSMPDQLFYPVGVVTIVMLFKAHIPNSSETFFGSLKNDGFEITRTEGRKDTKNSWLDIKNQMLSYYKEKKLVQDSTSNKIINFDSEWTPEAHIDLTIEVSKENFEKELKKYAIFMLKGN
jgi:type I restriction enzyme M protein